MNTPITTSFEHVFRFAEFTFENVLYDRLYKLERRVRSPRAGRLGLSHLLKLVIEGLNLRLVFLNNFGFSDGPFPCVREGLRGGGDQNHLKRV